MEIKHERPFTAFNFEIRLQLPGQAKLCGGEFAECDGLEMNVSPKTIREGGNNGRVIHLSGPTSYGQLTLKRGMSKNLDLWKWFERSLRERSLRATAEVSILDSHYTDPPTVRARFELTGCLPIKLKAPGLNAKDGTIAVEEMQIVYETLTLQGSDTAGSAN